MQKILKFRVVDHLFSWYLTNKVYGSLITEQDNNIYCNMHDFPYKSKPG